MSIAFRWVDILSSTVERDKRRKSRSAVVFRQNCGDNVGVSVGRGASDMAGGGGWRGSWGRLD